LIPKRSINKSDITDNYASTEVTDSIGELVNQIAGKARQELEKQFGISLKINQPKAIQISSTIMMSIAADINKPQNRRISFKTEQKHPFYLELSIEHTEMISLLSENEDTDNNEKELTIDELIALNRV
jgi:chemotaxis protein CheY-P-specific phosphatase CheC